MASVNGFTKDVAGNLLPSAICSLFKDNLDGTCSFIQQVTSDAVTAAYHFDAAVDSLPQYFVVAWKDDTPHVFDCTDHVLQPIADSGSLSAAGTAAVQTVGVGAGTGATGDVSMVGTGDMQFIGQGNGLAFLDGAGDMQLVGGPIGGGAFSAIGTGDEQMAVQATVPGAMSMIGTGDEQMVAANQHAPISITGTGVMTMASTASDPFFANVLLLLGNNQGPNAATVTAVNGADQSPSPRTVTVTGLPSWTNTTPPTGLSTSISMNGTTMVLSVPDSNDWAFTGDFCIEIFARKNNTDNDVMMWVGATASASIDINSRTDGNPNSMEVFIGTTANGFELYGTSVPNIAVTQDVWTYYAIYRSGANLYATAGAQGGNTATPELLNAAASGTVANVAALGVGYGNTPDLSTVGWNGLMGPMRITNSARGLGATAFAVPTLPFPTS